MHKGRQIITIIISGLLMVSLLTACGFKPRSAHEVPPQLRVLYLQTPNRYSPLIVQLRRALAAVNIRLVSDRAAAPVTLDIRLTQWSYSIPSISDSANATSYAYTLSVQYALVTRNCKEIIPPAMLSLSRSVVQNANQTYTPDMTKLAKAEIIHSMVNLIYNRLISLHTQRKLNKILPQRH